jgi:hypothetical protein
MLIRWSCSVTVALMVLAPWLVSAEVIHVDSRKGQDANPGSAEDPLRSLAKASEIVNGSSEPGPTTIRLAPGRYDLDETVLIANRRLYTETDRLTIEAAVLPGDPNWLPHLMPVIVSKQVPKASSPGNSVTETYSLKIKVSHVTVRGLKFLGNAASDNWHNCVERVGDRLDDLLVTQCVFEGDRSGADIYCATLATGNRFVMDHCVFRGCGACVVFWEGLEGIAGRGCAMRHCIVDHAYLSGVWTCRTAEDLEFHHNVVTDSEYVWLRKPGDTQTYRLRRCVTVNNRHESGYDVASGPIGPTDETVRFDREQVIQEGVVLFDTDKTSRTYGHIAEHSIGNDLGAGLFISTKP